MSEYKFVFAGEDTQLQRDSIPMLARCFEEWQMFQAQYGNVFPFREISFAALNDRDEVVGHVGIMPFDIFAGNGDIIRMAGVASVGTDPDYRYRGIAAELCNMAAVWAEENGFDTLALYTSFNRVYESCGWQNYNMRSVSYTNPNPACTNGRKGSDLSDAEKRFIIECYEQSAIFPGKVIRTQDNSFHGWDRIFRETFFDWYVAKNGYAVAFEGVLAEFFVSDGDLSGLVGGIKSAFLPENFPYSDTLLANGWQKCTENTAPECWHGENVMTRDIGNIPSDLFFSLVDKF